MIKTGNTDKVKTQVPMRSVSLSVKSVFLASLLFLFLFFNLTNVSAVPPVSEIQQFPEGYTISEQQIHTFKFGEPLRYGFILENTTDGRVINESSINCCRIITSNSQGFNTQVTNITYNDTYNLWGIELNESEVLRHFPEIGNYNYVVSCQDGRGGVVNGIFEITESGLDTEVTNTIFSQQGIILLIVFLIGLITFIIYLTNREEYYLTIIAGILFIFAGVYSFYVLPLILESLIADIISVIIIAFGLLSLSESIWRFFPN